MLCGRGSKKYGMKMYLFDCVNTVVYSLWEIKIGTTVNMQFCHFWHHGIKKGFCKGIASSVIKHMHVEQSAGKVNGVIGCNWTATQ